MTAHRSADDGWHESQVSDGTLRLRDHLQVNWNRVWADVDAEATRD